MKKQSIRFLSILLSLVLLSGCAVVDDGGLPKKVPEEIAVQLQEADELYANGRYGDSLEKYLTVIEQDMKNMEARFGTVRCQIALGNIELAVSNLDLAQRIDPAREEICDLYFELSNVTGQIWYGQNAVEIAKKYGHEEILRKIPAAPVLEKEPGSYTERLQVPVSCTEAGAEVYYSLSNSLNGSFYASNSLLSGDIPLLRGENWVSVYSLKDGIPSEAVTGIYEIQYPEEEVTFLEPKMEELVRYYTNVYDRPLTNYDCEQVYQLSFSEFYNLYSNYNQVHNIRFSTLEDLRKMPGIQYLYLNMQTKITDYSPLLDCPAIYQISLSECGLTDTSVVSYVPGLLYLHLSNNKITDITHLEQLTDLLTIGFYYNKGDLFLDQVLLNNPGLFQVNIDSDKLADYGTLTKLENLQYLTLIGLEDINYEALAELTGLLSLDLERNYNNGEYNSQIKDLSFLTGMRQLESLTLSGLNDAAQLEYIKQLPNLRQLYLYDCRACNDAVAMSSLMQALPPNCSVSYY